MDKATPDILGELRQAGSGSKESDGQLCSSAVGQSKLNSLNCREDSCIAGPLHRGFFSDMLLLIRCSQVPKFRLARRGTRYDPQELDLAEAPLCQESGGETCASIAEAKTSMVEVCRISNHRLRTMWLFHSSNMCTTLVSTLMLQK